MGGPAGAGLAVVPVGATSPAVPFALPPAPRALTGDTRRLLKHSAYGVWDLMNSDSDKNAEGSLIDYALIAFFSVVTAGIMPMLFISRASARKRRMRPFITNGVPAIGQVIDLIVEKIEFEARLARVRYSFEADGRKRLGSDRILPKVADLWVPGTEIKVLYLPDRDYDSVIIGSA
jgi:hypothetical protein